MMPIIDVNNTHHQRPSTRHGTPQNTRARIGDEVRGGFSRPGIGYHGNTRR